MTMKLFGGSDGSSSDEEEPKIEINEKFARRYEHNKKREELQRYAELKKKGVIDSDGDSDDDSDSDVVVESSDKDLKFFDALIKVKKQDPVLKDKEAKLFESDDSDESEKSEEEGEDSNKEKKRKKPMYLKDVTAKHLIEEGAEFEDKEVERKKSYVEEQEELRRAFLKAAADEDEDEDDEFLKEKKGDTDEFDEDGEGFGKKLDEYFGDDDKLDENEMFLKDYFRKQMWLEKDDVGKKVLGGDDDVGISEDEEEIEKQEDYERGYNFRYEENVGDRVLGHSRVVEGSVRKKTNARKLQRQSKEERMAQAEFERKEELKHLKNLKKKEISEKLKKIRETAGFEDDAACLLDEEDLEEEFDPDEYDKKMKKAFDDDYYEADDADPRFGSDDEEDGNELEKPDFDKEDELLGLPKGWNDEYGSGDGFSAARERMLKRKMDNVGDSNLVEEDDVVTEEGKVKKKRKRSAEEKEVLGKELEEYYKLDYEDTIGDLKTRFKYRPVKSKSFGISTKEVLLLDDKELNQFVSLKKIAPYVEKEWQIPRNKRLEQKQRIKSLIKEASVGQSSKKIALGGDGKKSSEHLSVMEKNKEQPDDNQNGESRHAKRKRNQAELKLSLPRLLAYGKTSSKPKSKKKP